jgi:hypothetical protein
MAYHVCSAAPASREPGSLAAFKTLFHALIERVGGVHAASAALGGYPASHLSEAASLHKPDRAPRVDHVATLEAIAGLPLVTAHLARLHGASLAEEARDTGCPVEAIAATLRSGGEVGGQIAAALADGAMDGAELRRLLAAVDALCRAADTARARLLARMG